HLDAIQVAGQLARPLARCAGVGAPGRLLERGADVGDGLEAVVAPRAPHVVPEPLDGPEVTPIQGVQYRGDVLPAVPEKSGDQVCEPGVRVHEYRVLPAVALLPARRSGRGVP